MKVVIVDKDTLHNKKISHFLEVLGLEFSCYESFLSMTDEDNSRRENIVHAELLLVAVDDSGDPNFTSTLELKESLLPAKPIIIFMVLHHDDDAYIRSLKYGDGYLLKPFNDDLLVSAINYHKKHTQIHRLLEVKNNRLLEYKKATDREHDIVESIFAKQFEHQLVSSDNIRYHISPASVFNGDVLLSEIGPNDAVYLAVGDVTGHGLSAAIGSLPVYSTFRNMAKKGSTVGEVAQEMNRQLQSLLPDNMLMALTIMQLNYSEAKAVIWSGGMPDVLLVNQEGAIVRKISSRHAPLSMLKDDEFRRDIDIVDLCEGDRIFFYTDGIEEAKNSQGEMFGTERLESLFGDNGNKIFNRIITAYSDFIKKQQQEDDITLVEVIYNSAFSKKNNVQTLSNQSIPSTIPWQVEFTFLCESLKQTEPLKQVFAFINNLIGFSHHTDFIATIIVELFNNALDHGVLQLDSGLKDKPDGFVNYYIERQKKISMLESGEIILRLNYVADKQQLLIDLTDSGSGFDYEEVMSIAHCNDREHGHGLKLISGLCEYIQYSNQGRSVQACYHFQ